MNQAITKMAPVQKDEKKKKKKAQSSVFVLLYRSHVGWQMGLGRSTLKDEVRYMCFLHLQPTSNVIVI